MKNAYHELSQAEVERYSRQIQLREVGPEGQSKLKASSVIVIGAGGLGCAALAYLAAAGVGKIEIVDHDLVEESNLPRQILYHRFDKGKSKAETALARLSLMNPHVAFKSLDVQLTAENAARLIANCDAVVDATDNFAARYAINDACVEVSKPFVSGSINHFEGQVGVFNTIKSNGMRSPDYRSLYPYPASVPKCSEEGVLGALPGIIGSIQALEAIKLLLQITPSLAGRLLKLDTLNWKAKVYELDDFPDHKESFEIDAEMLHQKIKNRLPIELIDIREECNAWPAISGILRVPFSRLFEECGSFSRQKVLVFFCHQGFKSFQAVQVLKERYAFKEIYSLKDGFQGFLDFLGHKEKK
jgi:sulfur-carrier protein adenylyltransferase/sulfurtransferase